MCEVECTTIKKEPVSKHISAVQILSLSVCVLVYLISINWAPYGLPDMIHNLNQRDPGSAVVHNLFTPMVG